MRPNWKEHHLVWGVSEILHPSEWQICARLLLMNNLTANHVSVNLNISLTEAIDRVLLVVAIRSW